MFTFKVKIAKKDGKHKCQYHIQFLNRNELEKWRLTNLMTMIEAAKCFKMSVRIYQTCYWHTDKHVYKMFENNQR